MKYANVIFLLFVMGINSAFGTQYRAALVADMNTGQVLYKENADMANYPASLTKIMTVYLTFDALEHGRLHLDDYLIVSNFATQAEPVKLGLSAGSKIRVEDAIKALTVMSANDVARVLAENLKGGKEGNFADLMTRVANEIGLKNTNFENSSGLPNDDHLSTARDIALLSMAVYKHFPQYWKYFGIKTWTYNGKTYTNGNRLLGGYPGCDGMKTGYTNKSRYSLVATAERGGEHLMAVILGAQNKDVRASVATNLLNRGFAIKGIDVTSNYTVAQSTTYSSENASTISAAYTAATTGENKIKNQVYSGEVGSIGIQFGAFSSRDAANIQISNVKNKLGINAKIEIAPNGMYRVRIGGLSEYAAQNLKTRADANGIDCFVFH